MLYEDFVPERLAKLRMQKGVSCLLYTSDAADEL